MPVISIDFLSFLIGFRNQSFLSNDDTYAGQMSEFAIECLHFSMIMFDFHLQEK